MTSPKISPGITYGNIVSWGVMILLGFGGYVKLQDSNSQNTKDISEARATAKEAQTMVASVKDAQVLSDRDIQGKLSAVAVDIAIIKTQIGSMDKKLDEIAIQNKSPEVNSSSKFAKKE